MALERRAATLLVVAAGVSAIAWTATRRDAWAVPPVPYAVQRAVPAFDAEEADEAREERGRVSTRPTVAAAFAAESYRPGAAARLAFFDHAHAVSIQVYVVGAGVGKWGNGVLGPHDVMRGLPAAPPRQIGEVRPGTTVRLAVAHGWPSGLYYAEVRAAAGRVGYAPFVVAPSRLGLHRIAVVLPTLTWQAYNFRDDNGDGVGDTWYAGHGQTTARLHRPFENRGVPSHYKFYDEPFLRWLAHERIGVDVVSDYEIRHAAPRQLRRAYDAIVFPGHEEYVTQQEYDAVKGYRDRGGSLIFLSANNFYSKVRISGGVMTRVGWFRFLGQPESQLVGVQFYFNDLGEHRAPWTVRPTAAGRWIFNGTRLEPGDTFSSGGIEADEITTASPLGTTVLAEIVDLYGDGRNAQMTYYETPRGAKVFAAGAFTLACAIWESHVSQVVRNLLTRMAGAAA